MRVFLTGGTGLVGSHLAEALRARDDSVVALQRPSSDTTFLETLGCEIARGDLADDPDRIARSVGSCTHAVHAAAWIYPDAPWPEVRAVNVVGAGNALRAAARAGAQLAVHVSSIAVYGNPPGPLDEESPTDAALRPGDLYARSKREAEAVARRVEEETGLTVTVVRPSAIYGERDRLLAPKVARLVRLPVVPLLGDGTNTVPVVYAGNVADALLRALDGPGAGGVFNLSRDHPLTQRGLVEGLAAGLGRSPRLLPVPAPVVRAGARLGDRLGLEIPGARDLSLSRVARLALEDNPYPSERARRVLGWAPPHEHPAALRRTGEWILSRDEAERPGP